MVLSPVVVTAIIFFVARGIIDGESQGRSGGGSGIIIPIILVFLFGLTVLANTILARYITKKIMTPINTLAVGVREIASGNLSHRITYSAGDEFDPVCADFNEMAARLLDMVNAKLADENSRKELIAGISHDLRTPLTSVKAYIEGLRKGVATTPQMQEKYLDIIQSKTEDIEYIIKQLFMFSKIDIGEFPLNLEVVDIDDILAKIVAEEPYQKVDVFLDEGAGVNALIDVIQFKNIIQNILGNSAKYTNREAPRIKIVSKKMPDNSIEITITDNGPGVPEEMIPKIFDVFYRGDKSRSATKGSGLGLAISAKIINRHGGTIRAKNAPTGGLAIIINLKGAQHEKNPNN